MTEFSVQITLSCDMFVYNVEKPYVETESTTFRLLSLLKVSITGLLFFDHRKGVDSGIKLVFNMIYFHGFITS